MSSTTPIPAQADNTRGADAVAQEPRGRRAGAMPFVMVALLVVLDVLIALSSLYVAYIVVFSYIDWSRGFWQALWTPLVREWRFGVVFGDAGEGFGPYFAILPFVPIIRVLTTWKLGLYDTEGEIDLAEDLVDVFRAVTIGTILIIVFVFCYRDAAALQGSYHQSVFLWDWMLCIGAMAATRIAYRKWQVHWRRRGRGLRPVIVIGDNPVAHTLRDEVKSHPEIGYRFVEQLIVSDEPEEAQRQLQALPELIRKHDVREVFIATTHLSQYQILSLIMSMGPRSEVSFKLVPDLLGCFPRKVNITQLGNVPLLELFAEPIRGTNRALKRALDIVVSVVALTLFSPVLLLSALAIKLTSKGPVLFKQTRIGQDCRPFTFYKLRSMVVDADNSRHAQFMAQVIAEGRGVRLPDGRVVYKEEDDPRITPVGRILRRYSIDEVPQFFNVLRGDMSVVGPRPPIAYEVEKYQDWQKGRMSAKPGITGVWQVSGRNAVSFEEMVKMDIAYMENWSLWGDIRIILRTIPVVLRGGNAF